MYCFSTFVHILSGIWFDILNYATITIILCVSVLKMCTISLIINYLHASHLVRTRTTMEMSNIPIAFCVILGNLIICYIIITVLHVLFCWIKSNQIKIKSKDAKYLGVTVSDDLEWTKHIDVITSKANSKLSFLRRNPKGCPEKLRETAR